MALVKVEIARKKAVPFTREKSQNESKNEFFLGKSGINFREKAIATLGFVAGDKIGFTPDIDMLKGETITSTTEKLNTLYFQKDEIGYKLGTNNAITGTSIAPYLIELAGITSRFATKLVNAKPTDMLSINEVDEILKGKQLVFTIAEEPIEFEDKFLYEVTFKEITESKRGRSVIENEVEEVATVEHKTSKKAKAVEVEEEL